MPRSTRTNDNNPKVDGARLCRTLRYAAVAAILFDFSSAQALLDLPDVEVGRLFKIRLAQVIGLSTALNLDPRSLREHDEAQRSETNRGPRRRTSTRDTLVTEGKLLRAPVICEALGISEQRLTKDVVAGRIFSVEIKTDRYYPAFFLANELDRRQLVKVVRRLGGFTGWAKWNFFTKPKASLANLTPLQVLLHGEAKLVLQTADALVARSKKVAKGKGAGS